MLLDFGLCGGVRPLADARSPFSESIITCAIHANVILTGLNRWLLVILIVRSVLGFLYRNLPLSRNASMSTLIRDDGT